MNLKLRYCPFGTAAEDNRGVGAFIGVTNFNKNSDNGLNRRIGLPSIIFPVHIEHSGRSSNE